MAKRSPLVGKACEFCGRDFRLGDEVHRVGGAVVHLRCPKPDEVAAPAAAATAAAQPTKKGGALPRARVKVGAGAPAFKSKLEERYYAHLAGQARGGEIAAFSYEPEKLRLADGTFYTPDFRVVTLEGFVQFHETKGFMREAARIRLNVAAELHPYEFLVVYAQGTDGFTVRPHGQPAPGQKASKKRA